MTGASDPVRGVPGVSNARDVPAARRVPAVPDASTPPGVLAVRRVPAVPDASTPPAVPAVPRGPSAADVPAAPSAGAAGVTAPVAVVAGPVAAVTGLTVAATGLAQVFWGGTYVVTTEFLPPDRPLFTALVRALPAGLLLLAVTRVLPRGDWWWRAAVLGALNIGAFFPLLFLAAYRMPGGMAAVAGSVGPLLVAGLGTVLLSERVRARTVVTGLAAVAGVALVMAPGIGTVDAVGTAAAFGSAGAMSLGTVLGKRWGRPAGVGPLALTGWQLTAGGLVIAPLALAVEGAPPAVDGPGAAGYAYLALVNTALAYWLWFRGLGRMTATGVAFLVPLSPLTATVLGWGLLGEALTAVQVVGMAVALGATVAGQASPRFRRRGGRIDPPPAAAGAREDVTSREGRVNGARERGRVNRGAA